VKIIGSDVVEFTPIYDNAAETTGIAVGQIIFEILHWMVSFAHVSRGVWN
jgi:agmatinase